MEAYLESRQIATILKDVVLQLGKTKPDRPIEFMVEYLQTTWLPRERRDFLSLQPPSIIVSVSPSASSSSSPSSSIPSSSSSESSVPISAKNQDNTTLSQEDDLRELQMMKRRSLTRRGNFKLSSGMRSIFFL